MNLLDNNEDILNHSNIESDSSQNSLISEINSNDQAIFQPRLIEYGNNSLEIIEIEAEKYHDISSTEQHQWILVNEKQASNGQALHATPDIGISNNSNYLDNSPQLDYIINFKEAGNYYAWVFGRAAGELVNQSDSIHLGLNSQKVETAERISSFADTFSWSNMTIHNTKAMIEIFAPGTHVLNLWMREDGFTVDKVILTTEVNFDPSKVADTSKLFEQSQKGRGVVEIEAEQYHQHIGQKEHQWKFVTDSNASGSGAMLSTPDKGIINNTGYVDKSPRLDYAINFHETGDHYVWVLGRAGGNTVKSSNSLHVGLDGQGVSTTERLNGFTSDFGWLNQTMNGTPAMFEVTSTGTHTLNLWMREDGFVVDKVILTTDPNLDPNIETNPDLVSEPTPIFRQEPTANVGYDNPPFSSEVLKQSWGAGQGLAPQLWFWEDVPEYKELESQITRDAAKNQSLGRVPYAGLQLWKGVFDNSQPDGNGKYSQLPGHQAWIEWLEARPEYLGVNKNGDSFDWGYVSPLVPLNKKDYPSNFEGDVAYYADWQADRLGRLAAFTGANGFFFSDFFDSHPHSGIQNYFNPLIIEDFENTTNVDLSSNKITEQAQKIRSQYYPEWLDYWVDRWAYNWSAIDREVRQHTGESPLLITQTSYTPAAQRRHGAVDPRVIFQYMSPDNILLEVQTIQNFMMRRLPVPESYESASIGLYAAREPEGYYGHILMSSEDRYWDAVEDLWPDLNPEVQQELGWKRLKRTWLESGWTHVLTRQGNVRRAAESWTRSYHDEGEINETWVELLRDIDPTRPFGPALYYSASIEKAYEIYGGANRNPINSSYLGEFLQPVTTLKDYGVPFNYYVSDAALGKLQDDISPSAWIVPDRYLEGTDLLPTEERQSLEKIAPILSEEEAKTFDYPLSFSSNQEGRTINGFGFYDQNDRLIVVASDYIIIGEDNNNLGKVQATIQLKLPDGNYQARNLLNGQEIIEFEVTSGSGKLVTTIDRWDTEAFEIIPI